WTSALRGYFDAFSGDRNFFLTNVPYVLPVPAFYKQDFKLMGDGGVAAFSPNVFRMWRGVGDRDYETPNVGTMADRINALPAGTVLGMYTSGDQGLRLNHIADMVELLGEDVRIVNDAVLGSLARQRGERRGGG
ncbi:hypothetical protein TeGR_g14024, partial [Tetraparma gracilis]